MIHNCCLLDVNCVYIFCLLNMKEHCNIKALTHYGLNRKMGITEIYTYSSVRCVKILRLFTVVLITYLLTNTHTHTHTQIHIQTVKE